MLTSIMFVFVWIQLMGYKDKSSYDHEVTLLTFESLSLLKDVTSVQICRSHPGFRPNVCCKECQIPICEKCLVFEHIYNDHQVILTEELFTQKKTKLYQKLSFLQSELSKHQGYVDELIKDEQLNEKSFETLKSQIAAHLVRLGYRLLTQNRKRNIAEYKFIRNMHQNA